MAARLRSTCCVRTTYPSAESGWRPPRPQQLLLAPCRRLQLGRQQQPLPQERRTQRRLEPPASAAAELLPQQQQVKAGTAAATVNDSLPAVGRPDQAESGLGEEAGSEFVWTRHWWPLAPESQLRTDRPNAVTLLGLPLVIWRDGAGEWRVFRDRCPHRLAPLSEGRVEADGSLSCSYHGWRFEGSGACRRIPQAADAASEAAACGSRRSCATAYPARLEAGMLWVWPDEAPDAATAAAATSALMSNELRGRGERYDAYVRSKSGGGGSPTSAAAAAPPQAAPPSPVSWFMRDMPYSYEILFENLADPSHLPHSHHGVGPALDRYTAGAMPMQPSKAAATAATGAANQDAATTTATAATALPPAPPVHWTSPRGPDFEFNFRGNIAPDATISLSMPHHVMYTYRIGKFELRTELFAVPVAPGRSRFFSINSDSRPPPPPLGKLLRNPGQLGTFLLVALDPVVVSHRMLNSILDGDGVFLTAQDQLVREAEAQARLSAPAATATRAATLRGGADSAVHAPPAAAAAVTPELTNDGPTAASASDVGFWSRLYYLPAQSDGAVLAGRRWLEERAGGGPFAARQRQLLAGRSGDGGGGVAAAGAGPAVAGASLGQGRPGGAVAGEAPSPQERARRLDRYEQHTRHCPACSARLSQLQQLVAAAKVVQTACLMGMCIAGGGLGAALAVAAAAAGVTAAAAVAATAATTSAAAAAAVVGLAAVWAAAGWLAGVAERWSRIFLFTDYVHADKN